MTVVDNTFPAQKDLPKYEGNPSTSIYDALKLPSLFYEPGPWTDEKCAEWLRITGSREASTKVMCSYLIWLRELLGGDHK